MFANILAECIYRLNRDIKKWAIVMLIIFFAGFTAGFCAGKVVEESISIGVRNGDEKMSEVREVIHTYYEQSKILQ